MDSYENAATVFILLGCGVFLTSYISFVLTNIRFGYALFVIGWTLSGGIIALNWLACGHPPLGSMYHVLTCLAFSFLPLYLLLSIHKNLRWLHAYFAGAASVALVAALMMERDLLWQRLPALQSVWFVPHVSSYVLSYSLAAVAFLLTAIRKMKQQVESVGDAGPQRDYDLAGHRVLQLAFPFMTFGMLSGALWAEQAWGQYWSWDPKETWSLITWMLYLIYFHCRASKPLRRYAPAAQFVAFAALLVTFLVVNLVPKLASVLHGYA